MSQAGATTNVLSPLDISAKLAQCDQLAKQDDRASKFVVLFILLDVLSVSSDPQVISKCWHKIDGRLLDKMLLSIETASVSGSEATDLALLGLSILHAFAGFQIVSQLRSFRRRADAVMEFISRRLRSEDSSQREALSKALTVLQSIGAEADGAIHVLTSKRFAKFAMAITDTQNQLGLQLLALCVNQASTVPKETSELFETIFTELLEQMERQIWKGDTFLRALPLVNAIVLQSNVVVKLDEHDKKLKDFLKSALLCPAKGTSYADALLLMTIILQRHGVEWLNLQDAAERTFLVVLGSLAAADIRARLSSTSTRGQTDHVQFTEVEEMHLACNYDLMHCICVYLATSDEMPFDSEQILRLRDDFSAAFGETILYLRERWDRSSYSGIDPAFKNENNADETLPSSPCIIACTRALCFWLQEDESLHLQASHIIDVLFSFLALEAKVGVAYSAWIFPALDALVTTDDGRNMFNTSNGWPVVEAHLLDLADRVNRGAASVNRNRVEEAHCCLSVLQSVNAARFDAWMARHEDVLMRMLSS
ncbi:Neurochondrin-domain-containing protein [Protomyces lactucae-debilis]|uniref:Neurochondrin-domain-containing protein n=1 Tax=Protomyces lactucae-debilis TaxID=2754530 RepID=A0A1Y2FNE3_PROLT|nr:Neurochondrin-domain-containing protein [Protomyces lactucae-debilis]ORY85117.1 Neurochondrin-domain-containing protein [Protomyces lactucae-debilis]